MSNNKQLRKQAQKRLELIPELPKVLTDLEVGELIHELRVHQIELEAQNEELRTMQHRLEEVRDKYADLFDFAPIGYFIVDKKGSVVDVNLTGCRILGYERNRIIKSPFFNFLVNKKEDGPFFYKHLQNVFKSKQLQSCELKLRTKGGNSFYSQLDSIAEVDIDGETNHCRIMLKDLTGEKKTARLELLNKLLKHEKTKAQQYLELSGVIFLELDINGVITLINDAGCSLLQCNCQKNSTLHSAASNSRCQLTGQNWISHFLPDKHNDTMASLHEQIMHGKTNVTTFENTIWTKNRDHRRAVSWRYAIKKDELGNVNGVLYAGTDITPLQQAEVKAVSALLNGQENERQRIAADLHDSIQPILATIKRNIELFNPYIKILPQKNRKIYDQIREFINNVILEIKAITNNLASPSLSDFGLEATLNNLCHSIAHSENITVDFNYIDLHDKLNPSLSSILYRIVQELINNIVKHASATTITLQLIGYENSVLLMCEDDGQGFDTTLPHKGMGINNVMARAKVKKGTVNFDSQLGKGTTVTVEIPY